MAEVKWQARRTSDNELVDVTADVDGLPRGAPIANPIEAATGLPGQWTTDEYGNLTIAPDASPGSVDSVLILKGNGRPDVLMIEKQLSSTRTLGIDEDGYIATTGGADIGSNVSIATFGEVVDIRGGPVGTDADGSYLRVRGATNEVLLRVKGDGNILMPSLPTADPVIAGALWNDSGTLKVSAG